MNKELFKKIAIKAGKAALVALVYTLLESVKSEMHEEEEQQ